MSNHDKHFSSFQHTKIINGKKIKDKKILISINPDDKQKIYAYFKENDHQYLYSDKLEKFSNLILSQSNSQFDLIQLLKSDLESLNNFDLFKGQALHAQSLGFSHPVTGEDVQFYSELPEYFEMALKRFRDYCK